MNGHNPAEIFTIEGNTDSKAIIPSAFEKPPTINYDGDEPILEMYISTSEPISEYVVKYVTKGPVPPKTDSQLLAIANDSLQHATESLTSKQTTSMYIRMACDQELCIFETSMINMHLPLCMTNTRVKRVNHHTNKRLSKQYMKTKEDVFESNDIDKFNERFSISSKFELSFKTELTMRQFFDYFNIFKRNGTLCISKRNPIRQGLYEGIGLRPQQNLSSANPKEKDRYGWFCKAMCLWHLKWNTIDDNILFSEDKEETYTFWTNLFETKFPNGAGLEDVYKGYTRHYLER